MGKAGQRGRGLVLLGFFLVVAALTGLGAEQEAFAKPETFTEPESFTELETFYDAFSYPDGSGGEPAWRPDSISWIAKEGRMTFRTGQERRFLVLEKLGYGNRVEVEATLVVTGRTGDGWAVAGVALYYDENNFWHLALVEAPAAEGGRRFVELNEAYGGLWPANFQGDTRLKATTGGGNPNWQWEYNRPYRLRLTLTPNGIEGVVSEPGAKGDRVRYRLGWAFSAGTPAVTSGAAALDGALFTGYFDDVKARVGGVKIAKPEEPAREFPPYTLPGWEEVQGEATGFFHLEEHGSTWWLMDPNGFGFFAVGTDHINYYAHWCEALGYAPYHRNVERKYGSEEAWAAAQAERLRAWGFNTLGAGHSLYLRYTHFAHTEWVGAGRSFAEIDNIVPVTTWTGFPNVFSPLWERHCDLVARRVCAPNRDDPWLIGYFLDNELQWFGGLDDWRNEYGLWEETWKKPPEHSAKQVWMEVVKRHCPDVEAFNRAWGTNFASFAEIAASTVPRKAGTDAARAMAEEYTRLVAEAYFSVLTGAIRRYDPNHLILGCRFAGWSPGIWDIAGKYCDVISFNDYPRIDRDCGVHRDLVEIYLAFSEQAQSPLWITEWSFPALDSGLPNKHGAGMRVATQNQKARCYRFFQNTLFALPFMVGSNYFMYIDQPALGISATFPEDSNYGLVDVTDEPWEEFTRTAAEVNPQAPAVHHSGDLVYVNDWPQAVRRHLPLPPSSTVARSPLKLQSGPLVLQESRRGGEWKIEYEGVPLGGITALIHQKTPRDHWVGAESSEVTAYYEGPGFVVVDVTFLFTRKTPGSPADGPGAYRAGYRFWVPKASSGWFIMQGLWVENIDTTPWNLESIFYYTHPAIGGNARGDEEAGFNVPNFYIPFGAWEDTRAGYGLAAIALGEEPVINYWKDKYGFHSDCRYTVGRLLQPGERYEEAGPPAVHFGYRTGSRAELLHRLAEVHSEALNLLQ